MTLLQTVSYIICDYYMATILLWLLCLEQTDCKTCGVDIYTRRSTFPCHCMYMTKVMNTSVWSSLHFGVSQFHSQVLWSGSMLKLLFPTDHHLHIFVPSDHKLFIQNVISLEMYILNFKFCYAISSYYGFTKCNQNLKLLYTFYHYACLLI